MQSSGNTAAALLRRRAKYDCIVSESIIILRENFSAASVVVEVFSIESVLRCSPGDDRLVFERTDELGTSFWPCVASFETISCGPLAIVIRRALL